MDAALLALMPRTLTVYSTAAPAADGADQFASTGVSYSARITKDPAVMMKVAGPVKDPSAVAWIASTTAISQGATIQLPDGTRPPIASVSQVDDEAGLYFVKVVFR